MKPIRYITHQNTVWYNVTDYTRLLLDTNTIWPVKPASPWKRHQAPKPPDQILLAKLNRLSPVYRIESGQELYADWVIFEHFYRLLKPLLIQPTDWTNPASLFRQIQIFIDHPKRVSESVDLTAISTYFQEVYIEG